MKGRCPVPERSGEMKYISLFFFICFLFVLVPSKGLGEDISVSLRLDREQATCADSIRMVVAISGTRDSGLEPIIHGLDDFRVERGGTSSKVEIINGRVNSGVEYIYFIEPKKRGTFEIGPAECKINGKVYRSNTETITVAKSAAYSNSHSLEPVFLTASLSSGDAYVGDQVFYTLKLYHQIKVSDISLTLPEIEYLSFKQLGEPVEYNTSHRGQPYGVLEVRYVIIPSKTGTYHILPSRMHMLAYPSPRQSPGFFAPFFGDPMFSQGRRMAMASESFDLRVTPLPEAGRPADFSGLVGDFKIESRLEPGKIKQGESATFTLSVSGRGNVNCIPDLDLPELENAKIYADEPVLDVTVDSKGVKGSKTMKWAIVPEKIGMYKIPSLSISFFDPKQKDYRTLRSLPAIINVFPGKNETVAGQKIGNNKEVVKGNARQAVKELGHDILPIHSGLYYFRQKNRIDVRGTILLPLLSAPAFVYAAIFCIIMLGNRTQHSMSAARSKRAAKKIIRNCQQDKITHNELILNIREYLNDRFNLSAGSLTYQEAAQILSSNGVTADTVQEMKDLIDNLEDAVYTGRGDEPFDAKERIGDLVKKIEKEIR